MILINLMPRRSQSTTTRPWSRAQDATALSTARHSRNTKKSAKALLGCGLKQEVTNSFKRFQNSRARFKPRKSSKGQKRLSATFAVVSMELLVSRSTSRVASPNGRQSKSRSPSTCVDRAHSLLQTSTHSFLTPKINLGQSKRLMTKPSTTTTKLLRSAPTAQELSTQTVS
jgi:hypothetical protein